MIRPEPPFERTTCACKGCQACCRRQPGHLIPGDFERIQAYIEEHFGLLPRESQDLFVASPGMVLMNTRSQRQWRLGTITPAYDKKAGACVFFQDGLCTIHEVAPFGCAYADTHMTARQWLPRSQWSIPLIQDEEYQKLRNTLRLADHYDPTRNV